MCTWARRLTRGAGCWAWSRSRRTSRAIGRLIEWLGALGPVMLVGVEGTGSYGAGLTRSLQQAGLQVVEVDRPNRQARHRAGKSDPLDAITAARAALSGSANGAPKSRTGNVEASRVLMVARRSAVEERITTLNQLRHLCITAPEPIRRRFSGLTPAALAKRAAALKPRRSDPCATRRWWRSAPSADEFSACATRPQPATPCCARSSKPPPPACSACSVSATTPPPSSSSPPATTPNVCAPRRPGRICAASRHYPRPPERPVRHRLNRGGDRQANRALYHVMITRLSHHEPTNAYVARRLAHGKTLGETGRMLKRYIAREVYKQLPRPA
jgi:transposase